jgi:hypothetical protein
LLCHPKFDVQQDPAGLLAAKRAAKENPQLGKILQKFSLDVPAWLVHGRRMKWITSWQLAIQGRHSIAAIQDRREIDFSQRGAVQIPSISRFPARIQEGLRIFFHTAYSTNYFISHTTNESSFASAVKSGTLLSKARIEDLYPTVKAEGLKDSRDRKDNEHRMVYASMGTDPDNLCPPSQYKGLRSGIYWHPTIIIDFGALQNHSPLLRSCQIVKGYDWREADLQTIRIGTEITITRISATASTGVVDKNSKVTYRYDDAGTSEEYSLDQLDDIATGENYRQLVPLLIVQHLERLSEPAQAAILAAIIKAKDGSRQEQEMASKSLLDRFGPLEASVGGSLPLRLGTSTNSC